MRNGFRKDRAGADMEDGRGAGRGVGTVLQEAGEKVAAFVPDASDSDAVAAVGDGKVALFSEAELQELAFLLEEEKLANNLYEAFYAETGATVFRQVARSEDKHFSALLKQAEKAGIDTDDILSRGDGDFVSAELQALHDDLLARGSVSREAALEVGIFIERTDMIDLAAARDAVEGTKLSEVYDRLLDGSANHLGAFEAALGL